MELQSEIREALSDERFGRYLTACSNNVEKACTLYLWNMQVSSAFFPWLSVAEVVLRNRIHLALSTVHGSEWPWANGFERTLPQAKSHGFSLLEELQNTRKKHERGLQTGKVIADLKFAFWQQMLKKNQESPLWDRHLFTAFPNLDRTLSIRDNRKTVYQCVDKIRELRNRIAHHEPIFNRDLNGDYQNIIKLIGICHSQKFIDWLKQGQQVGQQPLLEFFLSNKP